MFQVLDTIVLDKLRNSGLVAPCDARRACLHALQCTLLSSSAWLARHGFVVRTDGLLEAVQPCAALIFAG
ncbi:MAG: hypothetical protein ACLTD2_05105 [Ruminococcus sp.]